VGRLDLNRDLIKIPLTFYVRVEGDSMEPRIHPGELLVVDRMVETKDGDVVVARLGQEFTVKRLHIKEDGRIWLVSENPEDDRGGRAHSRRAAWGEMHPA
jgi:DNA polymerase V